MARLAGFEPTTSAFAGLRSIQLSYKARVTGILRGCGAEGEIRTHTPLRALRPERSASNHFATPASCHRLIHTKDNALRGRRRDPAAKWFHLIPYASDLKTLTRRWRNVTMGTEIDRIESGLSRATVDPIVSFDRRQERSAPRDDQSCPGGVDRLVAVAPGTGRRQGVRWSSGGRPIARSTCPRGRYHGADRPKRRRKDDAVQSDFRRHVPRPAGGLCSMVGASIAWGCTRPLGWA